MADYIGQQLGNYRLVRLLGEGGFALVFLGEHVYLGTHAAVKVLNTKLTEEGIALFRDEARTIIGLEHPNIVRVFDFGMEGRVPFIVMTYANNGSLREAYPKGTRLPLSTIVTYVKQIADALKYIHDQKLIHRDIKPENMLVGRNNEILLTDFGIAAIAHSTHSLKTQDGSGTIYYMAPEQIQGKPRIASDQYSLGIVVYEWLSGVRPFNGTYWEIASQHLSTPPPPFARVLSISPSVEQVVMKALSKDPQQRFVNIRDFAVALEQVNLGYISVPQQVQIVPKPVENQPVPMSIQPAPAYPTAPFSAVWEWLKEAYEAVRSGRLRDPQTIRDIAARFEAHANDPNTDVDAFKAAQILYHRAWVYEQKAKEQSRVAKTADPAVQSDLNEHGQVNDNIYSGG
jgi:serine/threonine protein kinase